MNFGQWTYSGQGHLMGREPREEIAPTCCSLSSNLWPALPNDNSITIWKPQAPWRGAVQNSQWELAGWQPMGSGSTGQIEGLPAQGFQTQWGLGLWAISGLQKCVNPAVGGGWCGGCIVGKLLTQKHGKKTGKQNINAYLNICLGSKILFLLHW